MGFLLAQLYQVTRIFYNILGSDQEMLHIDNTSFNQWSPVNSLVLNYPQFLGTQAYEICSWSLDKECSILDRNRHVLFPTV